MNRGWILITGCSTGIGRALVGQLRARGYAVVATARKVETLSDLPPGGDLRALSLDVTDAASIAAAVEACRDLRFVGLVNNAGYGQIAPMELLTPEELRAQFETNVVGLHAMTRAFLPLIRAKAAKGEGRIVHIASVLGRVPIPLAGAYNASKHAVVALAESLRLEIGDEIPVLLVEPGAIRTEFRRTLTSVWGDLPARAEGTRYARILRAYLEKKDSLGERWALAPERCAARIAAAIAKRRPPRRLVIGKDAFWALKAKAILPAWLWERALRRTYGLRQA
ncbi:MAG TPA: SDR family NAD(P)-dependent oxidoreductase [Holophagaceae bacterium]|nr:SDR family NAD(P)-dependent oxidoreductase [Holophagaceae bacterium]